MFYLYKAITRTSRHHCYLCTYKCKHLPVCVPADINPCTWTCRIYPCKSLSHLLWPLWQNAIGDLQVQVVPEDRYLHTCRCLPIYLCSRHSPLLGPLRQDAVRDLHVQVAVPENGLPADLVLAGQVHGEAQVSRHRNLQQRVPAVIYLLMTLQSLEYL